MRASLIAIATVAALVAGTGASSSSKKSSKSGGGSFVISVNGPSPAPVPAPAPTPAPLPPITGPKSILCNVCGHNKVLTCAYAHPDCYDFNPAVCGVPTCPTTLVDVVASTPTLSSLLTSVVTADLANTLAGPGPFTVFAPNDAAFAAIAQLASTLSVEQLQSVLLLHVKVGRKITASQLYDGMQITTGLATAPGTLIIRKNGMNGWKVTNADGTSSANIVLADQFADNGVAHVIDGVILPPANTAPPVYTPAPPAPPAPSPTVYTCSQTRKKDCKTELTNGACAWNRDVRKCRPAGVATPCAQQRKKSCNASTSCQWQKGQGCSDKPAAPPPAQCTGLNAYRCGVASNCKWLAKKNRCKTMY